MSLPKSAINIFQFICCICIPLLLIQCKTENKIVEEKSVSDPMAFAEAMKKKQRGAHVFGRIDSSNLKQFVNNNIEWITLVPYAGQEAYNSPTMRSTRGDSTRIRESNERWINAINSIHESGMKAFVKPHLWLHSDLDGKWRSDVFPSSNENWQLWQASYREFIFRYARIAEQTNAEMFCIGAEFTRLTLEKTEFWNELIKDVRKIYSGELTYAANWYKEYEKITFWDQLDYIGIQAYFPLVKNEYPSTAEISDAWKKYKPDLAALSKKHQRKILFTELGYKSTADSAIKPWEWIDYMADEDKIVSEETQVNCYQAFFDTLWKEDWFAGVHIWQTRSDYDGRGNLRGRRSEKIHLDFTPQGKPAEEVISKGFSPH